MSHQIRRPATAFASGRTRQRNPREQREAHLKWVRTLPSLVPSGIGWPVNIEAAHIRMSAPLVGKPSTGMAEKPSDCWVVPLCAERHREQHSMNERRFLEIQQINPVVIAALLWALSQNDNAGQEIVLNARAISSGWRV
jgi:hypothetical protein